MHKMGRASSSFTMSNTRSSHYPLFAAASFLFLLILICSSSSSPFTAAAAVEEDPCSSNYALASAPPSMLPPTKLEEMEEANSSATDVLINPHDQPPQLPAAARQQRRVPKAQTLPLKQGASQSSQLLLDFGRQQPSCLYHMTFKTSCYSPTPVNDLEFALDIRDVYGSDVVTFLVNPYKYPCAISTLGMTGRCPRHPLYYLRIRSNGLDGWVLKYVSFRVIGTIFRKPVFFCIGRPLPPTSNWIISNCCQYGGDRAGNRCDNHQDEGGEE